MNPQPLLIELGTEELPPKALQELSAAFSSGLLDGLLESGLIAAAQVQSATPFATPRRLALLVPDVAAGQPDQVIERRGPALQAAYQDNGEPTPAALGFARSCGVGIEELQRLVTDKGEWLSYNIEQAGKTIGELIPAIIDQAVKNLPIPKRMRWGSGSAEFVRPVHWLIVMHGNTVIPSTVLQVVAGNATRGHRFHSNKAIVLAHAGDYERVLNEDGHVIASFAKRRALIKQQVEAAARTINAVVEPDQALLDEVTGLVEQPTALLGEFDPTFLEVPQECLVSSMRDHQKYFHVTDADGRLMPNFITVSNIASSNPARVIEGNERVLRARLSDAQFFWQTDKKQSLEARVELLEQVLFHAKLGSLLDKTRRVQKLAVLIGAEIGADPAIVERAALLAKADLVSNMVNEFDELQGIMGHYYADSDGEAEQVGDCIEQHYWPRFAGDQLPASAESQAVALADKLDSLVGIYAAGEIPTGDKDPYALRRTALSILRILIEQQRPLKLSALVAMSASTFADQNALEIDQAVRDQLVDFIRGRLTAYYQNQGIATSTINAVLVCKPDSPLDFANRLQAVDAFSALSEAADLAAANKRISNILKKQQAPINEQVIPALLVEPAEKELHTAITTIQQDCMALFDRGDYTQGLQQLATLRTPVDKFFEHVMVMSDDAAQQQNRLALLKKLQQLFLRVADISQLQN